MPDKIFWDQRWENSETGWDVGAITTPIKEYIDQLSDKNIKILIPGAGNSYEAEYLHQNGFSNVFVIDISAQPLNQLKQRVPDFPSNNLINADFFSFTDSEYDLVLEQTFFCAIDPSLRQAYAEKMHQIIAPGGKLVGVLFDDALNADKPPFGGHKDEYISYFAPFFNIRKMEPCYNSIKPRAGRELFIILERI